MYLHIISNSEGRLVEHRKLQDDDILDCETFALEYADNNGLSIEHSDGYVHNGEGDILVVITEGFYCDNTSKVYDSQSFYFKDEDY